MRLWNIWQYVLNIHSIISLNLCVYLYVQKADSVVNALSRVLTAISVVTPSIAEFLPIAHYVSSAIDFEWKTIQSNDKGQGVVCTGTW